MSVGVVSGRDGLREAGSPCRAAGQRDGPPEGGGRGLGLLGPDARPGGLDRHLPHLLTFLGKKVRSRLWSQRRMDRGRRELFGGCG